MCFPSPLGRGHRLRSFVRFVICRICGKRATINDTAVFGAVNAIGNGMRESRQNEMIYQERAELGAAREREAEMASRIRQLEMMQMQQAGGGGGQQPQIIIAQPPAMQLAPAK